MEIGKPQTNLNTTQPQTNFQKVNNMAIQTKPILNKYPTLS